MNLKPSSKNHNFSVSCTQAFFTTSLCWYERLLLSYKQGNFFTSSARISSLFRTVNLFLFANIFTKLIFKQVCSPFLNKQEMYWTWSKIFLWQNFFPISIEKIISCSRGKLELFNRYHQYQNFLILVIALFWCLKAIKWEINLFPSIHTRRLTSLSLCDSILAPLIVFNHLVDTKLYC